MSAEDEINAMKQIAAALEPLDESGRVRTLQWAISHFRGKSQLDFGLPQDQPGQNKAGQLSGGAPKFETFAELFEAANPSTEREKALVASYWAQICNSEPSFGSQSLNDELKDLGHGVGNITDALSALKDERPALVLQLKKSGTSKQARKTYKLTQEGIRRVHSMMSGEASGSDK